MFDRTLLRFLLVGAGNTALGLGVIFAARQMATDFVANLLGYLIVVPVSFLSHRTLSFRDRGQRFPAFARYLAVIALGYAGNLAVLRAGLAAGLNPYLVQTAAIGCHVTVTYALSRWIVFLHP